MRWTIPGFGKCAGCPEETLNASLPRLRKLTGNFKITGEIKIRPADLYVSTGYRQSGIVLVGDAFATSCPVTGTGTDKVFTDVAQLCNVHIPDWLSTDGMAEDKIAAFYDDPVKTECDAWSAAKAYSFRSVTIDNGLSWQAQRWARFIAGLSEGTLRRVRNRLGSQIRRADTIGPDPRMESSRNGLERTEGIEPTPPVWKLSLGHRAASAGQNLASRRKLAANFRRRRSNR